MQGMCQRARQALSKPQPTAFIHVKSPFNYRQSPSDNRRTQKHVPSGTFSSSFCPPGGISPAGLFFHCQQFQPRIKSSAGDAQHFRRLAFIPRGPFQGNSDQAAGIVVQVQVSARGFIGRTSTPIAKTPIPTIVIIFEIFILCSFLIQ